MRLRRRLDVAREKNYSRGLDVTEQFARGSLEGEAIEAANEKLANICAQGSGAGHAKGNCTESLVELFLELVKKIESFERGERIEIGSAQLPQNFLRGRVEDGELE